MADRESVPEPPRDSDLFGAQARERVPNFFNEAKRAASNSEMLATSVQKLERNRKTSTVYADLPTHGSKQRLHGLSLPEKASLARAVHTSVKKDGRVSDESRGAPTPFNVPAFNPDEMSHT